MALSVVDLYRDILPRTNCGDCGYATCLAFAGMVVSEKYPLRNCPHIKPDLLEKSIAELKEQYAQGKWLKRDMSEDALAWAKQRAASMELYDLPSRIGGNLVVFKGMDALELPYFNEKIYITGQGPCKPSGDELTRWEQVFIYNHMAQGGTSFPSGKMKSLKEFPNTVSKIKTMTERVEKPLQEKFSGNTDALYRACLTIGGNDAGESYPSSDIAVDLLPLPKVPVTLLFWDADPVDGYEAEAKLLFDMTITEHLDIESIMFLSERIKDMLCRPKTDFSLKN